MGVRWGVLLPTFDPLDGGRFPVVEAAERAEALGYDSVWVGDHLLSPAPVLDSLVALAAAAAVTSRVELGIGVLQLALRHPVWVAKALASLSVLSGDRLRLGVGVGGEFPEEFTAAGVPVAERGRRLDEMLTVLPGLLAGDVVSHHGRYLDVDVDPGLRPAVAVPPISVGGRSDAALDRAARVGDQWLAMWHDADVIARSRQELHDAAARAGRVPPSVGLLVLAVVDEDEDAAAAQAEAVLAGQYRMPLRVVRRWTGLGSATSVAATLRPFVHAGVEEIVLMPVGRDPLEQYERLVEVRELTDRTCE